jgi:hypothetical protein
MYGGARILFSLVQRSRQPNAVEALANAALSARVEPRIPLAQAVHVTTRSGATLDPGIPRMDQRVGSWSTPHRTVCRTTFFSPCLF